MTFPYRLGVSLPVQEDLQPRQYVELAVLAEELGFDTAFLGEIAGVEAFGMLSAIVTATSRIRVGSGVLSVYSRSPMLTAMGFATLEALAPGRVVAGFGAGSKTVVESWHGRNLTSPLVTVEDFISAFRSAITTEPVNFHGRQVKVDGFRLHVPLAPGTNIPVLVGSFSPRMLELTGRIADGVLLSFCPLDEVESRIAHVRRGAEQAGRDPDSLEFAMYVHTYAGDEIDAALERFRRLVLQYAVQPTHRAGFVQSIPEIDRAAELWHAGRRKEALPLVSDEAVTRLCAIGDGAEVAAMLDKVREFGVDLPIIFPQSLRLGDPTTPAETMRRVAGHLKSRSAVTNRA